MFYCKLSCRVIFYDLWLSAEVALIIVFLSLPDWIKKLILLFMFIVFFLFGFYTCIQLRTCTKQMNFLNFISFSFPNNLFFVPYLYMYILKLKCFWSVLVQFCWCPFSLFVLQLVHVQCLKIYHHFFPHVQCSFKLAYIYKLLVTQASLWFNLQCLYIDS